jgi:ABC-type glycerol-3-phosphate transport system substrate-binding protein
MVAYFFMTRAIKLFSLLSVLIMLGVGLAACGGSSSSSFSAEDTMAVPAAEEAAPALTGYEQFVDTSMLRL